MPTNGTSPEHEPRIVTIRVRHRVATAAGAAMMLAMLPFLGGSVPSPNDSITLAAAAPKIAAGPLAPAAPGSVDSWIGRAAGGGEAAGLAAAQTTATVAGEIQRVTAGAGSFLFPNVALGANTEISALARTTGAVGLSWPLHGPEASGFGPRIHPVLGRPMFHTGIDLMAACGTPIRAAADGQVEYAAITPSWGRRVIIRHTTSLETGYAHMSQFLVKQGDVVRRGQVIGLVGTTGWSTGCHLHFDVIVNGHYVDPAPYLGLPGTSTAEVPYYASPHVESGSTGASPRTVEDGDVPITAAVPASTPSRVAPEPKPTTSTPSTTSSSTPSTSTGSSTTSSPTTSTSEPTTSTSSPTTSTSDPTTSTSSPTTTTTSEPPATTAPSTTSATTDTPSSTTTSEPPPTTTTTSSSAAATTPTPTSTATSSATETVAAATQAVLETTATGQG